MTAGLIAFATCSNCGWTVKLDVTNETSAQVAREIVRLASEHARDAHPGTLLATVLLDTFPAEES